MAKTNPCQVCGQVLDAEFTVSCFHPEIPPLLEGQPVVNVCLMCLLNWGAARAQDLADASQAALEQPEGALEHIEHTEQLEPLGEAPPNGSPKSRKKAAEGNGQEVPAAATAAPD